MVEFSTFWWVQPNIYFVLRPHALFSWSRWYCGLQTHPGDGSRTSEVKLVTSASRCEQGVHSSPKKAKKRGFSVLSRREKGWVSGERLFQCPRSTTRSDPGRTCPSQNFFSRRTFELLASERLGAMERKYDVKKSSGMGKSGPGPVERCCGGTGTSVPRSPSPSPAD